MPRSTSEDGPRRAATGRAVVFTGGGTPGQGQGVLAAIPGDSIAFGEGNLLEVDRGGAWHATRLPTSSVVESLVFSSPNHGFAYVPHVGSGPLTIEVYETDNGGTTWDRAHAFHPSSSASFQSVLAVPGGYVATASRNVEAEPLRPPLPLQESADGVHWHQLASVPASFLPIGAAQGPSGALWLAGTLGQSQGQLGWVNSTGYHPVLTTSAPLSDVAFVGSFGLAIGGVPSFKGGPDNQATQ